MILYRIIMTFVRPCMCVWGMRDPSLFYTGSNSPSSLCVGIFSIYVFFFFVHIWSHPLPIFHSMQGQPFMESLRDNKPLLYSLIFSIVAVFGLVSGVVPDVSAQFEIVEFTPDVSQTLVKVYLSPKILFLYEKGTHRRSTLHQHSEKKVHQVMK